MLAVSITSPKAFPHRQGSEQCVVGACALLSHGLNRCASALARKEGTICWHSPRASASQRFLGSRKSETRDRHRSHANQLTCSQHCQRTCKPAMITSHLRSDLVSASFPYQIALSIKHRSPSTGCFGATPIALCHFAWHM